MSATVAERFASACGRSPEGVWSAPGRVNLIGEHTDYNDGFVLPFATEMRTAVAAARRDDGLLVMRSSQQPAPVTARVDELAPGNPAGWPAYVAGVLWALRAAGHAVGGLDIVVDSDVPTGSGLSSSAALECAVALAARDLFGLGIDPTSLARVAQRAENDFVGMPCGLMDQMASMVCTSEHAIFLDTRTAVAEQIPFAPDDLGATVLIIDTRVHHTLVDGGYAARRASCEEAARRLGVAALRDVSRLDDALAALAGDDVLVRRTRHVVTENARVLQAVELLRAGDLAGIGPLLDASHASLRDDYTVSCPELDTAVEAAREAGALGARMVGGGFGGSAIALVRSAEVEQVGKAVAEAFVERGYVEPATWVSLPSAGARRDA